MEKRRAVITGMGVVSPLGTGIDRFWEAAVKGTNGIGPITSFDASEFRTNIGGEVRDFDPNSYLTVECQRRMGRSSQFAVAATCMAIAQSGIDLSRIDPYRVAVCMGTTMGEPQILEKAIETKYRAGTEEQIPPQLPGQYPCNVIAANISREYGVRGPTVMIPTACAAGNYALGYALDLIQLNMADVVIAGGSDPFSKIAFIGFNRLLATAKECCRPFDKNRDGMAVAEGAGVLVVEELAHAKRRGAVILAELRGYGLGCDAYKMTIPDPAASGGIIALRRALKNASIDPSEVDYVCAHGTGTLENDKSETLIIKTVMGEERARSVPVSSLKSMLGHTMGAASAIEAIACVLMIRHNTVLPTINYRDPDPECDLDYVPNEARGVPIDIAVSNAYAFGGNTSSIVLSRFNG